MQTCPPLGSVRTGSLIASTIWLCACGWGGAVPILLDTAEVDPADRMESLFEAFSLATMPCHVSISDPTGAGFAQVGLATFGPAEIFQMHGTGLQLRRTERQVQTVDYPPLVALAVQQGGPSYFAQDGRSDVIAPGQAMMVDLTLPYEFHWDAVGGSAAFQAPYDDFELPFDVIRRAAGRLAASSLCGVVTDHLMRLARDADALSSDPGAAALGVSTIQMIRALLTSAAGDDRRARDAKAEALLSCILAYTRQHLTERDLTPMRIAREHNISVRQLYTICSKSDIRLAEWIIEQRLEGARRDLADPTWRFRTIGTTATRWGFIDATHFGRRFRAAYGMSPRDFKHEHLLLVDDRTAKSNRKTSAPLKVKLARQLSKVCKIC
jgi:AraC-like DNA-binding protein